MTAVHLCCHTHTHIYTHKPSCFLTRFRFQWVTSTCGVRTLMLTHPHSHLPHLQYKHTHHQPQDINQMHSNVFHKEEKFLKVDEKWNLCFSGGWSSCDNKAKVTYVPEINQSSRKILKFSLFMAATLLTHRTAHSPTLTLYIYLCNNPLNLW